MGNKGDYKLHETIDKTKQITSLASLAVFRELYNKQTDIYGIISEFLNDVISSHGKYTFTLTEITNLLNQSFGFSIPEAVIGTSLGRINHINKEPDSYVVDKNLYQENKDISELKQIQIQNSNLIVENLFSFISQEKNIELGENEKEQIVQSFCSFLMDGTSGEEYSGYVSGFIIANDQNETFRNNLAKIREGVILYSGLTHNTKLNEVGSWKTELNIFLDTEMLFHFAGYNGVLFKSIFDDFFNYVTEINNTGKKKLIRLKYFTEVRERIERFFTKAEYIVKG